MADSSTSKTIRDAAVLLRSLPATQRTQLLAKLDPQQAAVVADEMNRLDQLSDDEQEAVLQQFAQANALPLKKRPLRRTAPFRFLFDLSAKRLARLLADEPSQAVALVLSHLPPQKAADLLAEMPSDRQLDIVCRIAATTDVSLDVIEDVENVLQGRLSDPQNIPTGHRGMPGVVRILNVMEPPAERRLLDALSQTDPPLFRDLRRAMFGADVADSVEWPLTEAAG
jgi:flagellar motor switch protein FliG